LNTQDVIPLRAIDQVLTVGRERKRTAREPFRCGVRREEHPLAVGTHNSAAIYFSRGPEVGNLETLHEASLEAFLPIDAEYNLRIPPYLHGLQICCGLTLGSFPTLVTVADLQTVVGKRIRELRTKRGFSQESFADECGLHRTYMGGIERGEHNLTLRTVLTIARTLGMTLAELLKEIEKQLEPAGARHRPARNVPRRPHD
jgi:DNA-binding XRE family transcriptional regulator